MNAALNGEPAPWATRARPSSTRHPIINRALPNRSAAAPSMGWIAANVSAVTADSHAAVAAST